MVELLKDEFVCEPRGKVEVKGVGEVETWFLLGEKVGAGDTLQEAALPEPRVRPA